MEEKKKTSKGLIVFIIILIIIIIGLVGYIAVDKGFIKLTTEEVEEKNTNTEEKDKKEEPKEEENQEVSETDTVKYYTDGTYYHLMLYPEQEITTTTANGESTSSVRTFYLYVNYGYGADYLTGTYETNENQITLRFPQYSNEIALTNILNMDLQTEKVELQKENETSYYITLPYTENSITYANLTLNLK